MDTYSVDRAELSALNKRRAFFAMCKASALLIAVTLLSELTVYLVLLLFDKSGMEIQHMLSDVLEFFGADPSSARVSARLVMGSEGFSTVISMLNTFITLVIPAYVFSRVERISGDECFNAGGKLVQSIIPVFCLCHLLTTFASSFSGMIGDFMLPDASEVYASTGVMAHEFNVYEFAISILCTGIFIPIVEEYVFRGVIFSYLRRYGLAFGVVASAVIFGIAHASPTQSVYAFVFGVFSALVMAVTGNIKTSILFHAGNNLTTIFLGYLLGGTDAKTFNIISSVYLLVVSAIGIYGIYAFCKKDGIAEAFRVKAEENDGGLCDKNGMKQLFVLPLALYIVYYVYNVFLTVM